MPRQGDLYRIFLDSARRTRRVHKWHHYFEIYEHFFSRFRGRSVTLLEIGVYKGGSLEMWRAYLGSKARIVGVDVEPFCANYATKGTQVFVGDQADPEFLNSVLTKIGPPDLVVDDGGHTAN